jgi:hypothetical protein
MKHLFSIMVVIGIVGLFAPPGLAGDDWHSGRAFFGHGERWQYVTIEFEHDVFYDVPLWPKPHDPNATEQIPGSKQVCHAVYSPGDPGVKLTGDVDGHNVLLSDLFCVNPDGVSARVEVHGLIIGKLKKGGKIYSKGIMVLDIDMSSVPFQMKGKWFLKKDFGTHHGVLHVEGSAGPANGTFIGSGTYSGWIRKNRY